MALVQGRLVAATSGDPGAVGDVLMVAFVSREQSCGQVNARGGRVVAGRGAALAALDASA